MKKNIALLLACMMIFGMTACGSKETEATETPATETTEEAVKEEQQESFAEISIEEHMKRYEDQRMDRKEAMKLVAKDRGISKRDVYQALLKD